MWVEYHGSTGGMRVCDAHIHTHIHNLPARVIDGRTSKHWMKSASICVPIKEGVASLVAMWKATAASSDLWFSTEEYMSETSSGSCRQCCVARGPCDEKKTTESTTRPTPLY